MLTAVPSRLGLVQDELLKAWLCLGLPSFTTGEQVLALAPPQYLTQALSLVQNRSKSHQRFKLGVE